MAIKCMIIDDEPLAIEVLESYVSRLDELQLVATSTNAIKAFELLKKQSVDLLFLDIQMPKLNGIEFLKVLDPAPKVIFTTAYREYALESYDLNVLDYLLKPISFERFLKAINKMPNSELALDISEQPHEVDEEPYIFMKADRKMVKVILKDICYIESLKDYIRIKTENEKDVVSLQKMSYMEEKLPHDLFLRIHRSYIVPIKKIDAFSSQGVQINGQEIPIGRNYKTEVMKILNKDESII
ncbi:MAG: response regulator transcription factor [Cytophagales bacterium]|nr:response regulator transcription factor [Cytophagales bacterium]